MFARACSGWSLGCGLVQLDQLLDWSRASALSAVCLADYDNLYGAVEFYRQATARGVRPILGAIVTEPARRSSGQTRLVVERLCPPKYVALAGNRAGYENLCRLVTARHMDPAFDLLEAAGRYQDGLFYLVDDPALLPGMIRQVEPSRLRAEIIDYGERGSRKQCYRVLDTAAKLGIEPVASHAAYFARRRSWHLHRLLRGVARNQPADQVSAEQLASPEAWLAPAALLRRRLAGYGGQAIRHAQQLIERCDLSLELGVPHFPKVPHPDGQTACARLCRLVWQGLGQRYAQAPREALARLRHELRMITKMGFADYFLVVHEIVQFARGRGIRCVGRGSAADSLVSYCLGISEVDPIRYNLHFERFLNESRTDHPDIDLDFDWRRRDEVIRFVYRHWGADHVAMIATQQFYKARSAFRDAARALGMPAAKLNRLTGRLPYDEADNLRQAIASMPECRDFPMHDPQVARAVRLAEHLAGLPRGLSVHVGGVVIAPRELVCYSPLQPATKGITITQYDMHAIEKVGLVKIDLLGHRSLAILADALDLVQRNHGLRVDLPALPEDDPATARVLSSGRTVGCFQIESPGVRQLLQMLQAKDLADVIHALSLIRPGPSASGMKERFIRRKRGLEPVTYLHPAMREVLADTYGVMLYQEDVMMVAAAVAGFTMATGDSLRKTLERRDSQEQMARLREDFLNGARQRGCDEATAEHIWQLVRNFAAYSYNKAHACTYGRISYWCTYLKTHYPAEFLTGVLNNIGGYYSLSEYVEEARRLGVPILPPHVNVSGLEFAAEPIAAQPAAVPCRVGIRVPLRQIRHLAEKTALTILQQRARRPFADLEDLLDRVRPSSREARSLIFSGACDGLGPSRAALLWQSALRRTSSKPSDFREEEQALLFRPAAPGGPSEAGPSCGLSLSGTPGGGPAHLLRGYSRSRRMELERQYLTFSPAGHATTAREGPPAGADVVRSIDLPGLVGRRVVVEGVIVAMRKAVTRRKDLMQFVSLEDRWGLVEVVLFPEIYKRLGGTFEGFGPYRASGMVQENLGSVVLIGESVQPVAHMPGEAEPLNAD